jgi:Caspase domain
MAKRALVAAVNDYSTWNNGVTIGNLTLTAPNLHWCLADANDFSQLLKDSFIFDEVTVLQDSQATSQAILTGINNLLSKSQAGDVVCFYFSGHGGRLPETPGDASTRYYEAIVPYDGNLVISSQVAKIADGLQPDFVNFTLVLDSCNSGGMYLSPDSRAFVWDSASAQAFQQSCSAIIPWICLPDPSTLDNNVSNLQLPDKGVCTMSVDASKDNPDSAKATLLSACDYGEESEERSDLGHGFFTKAIIDAVNACNFQINHTDLVAALRQTVSGYVSTYSTPPQTPQLRGRPVRLAENFLAGWNYSVQ